MCSVEKMGLKKRPNIGVDLVDLGGGDSEMGSSAKRKKMRRGISHFLVMHLPLRKILDLPL